MKRDRRGVGWRPGRGRDIGMGCRTGSAWHEQFLPAPVRPLVVEVMPQTSPIESEPRFPSSAHGRDGGG